MEIARSLALFFLAGLCEIGGGYLVWLWLREGRPLWLGLSGAVILAMYGVVATMQTANFGRVYAAYGGTFVVMALFWGWRVARLLRFHRGSYRPLRRPGDDVLAAYSIAATLLAAQLYSLLLCLPLLE